MPRQQYDEGGEEVKRSIASPSRSPYLPSPGLGDRRLSFPRGTRVDRLADDRTAEAVTLFRAVRVGLLESLAVFFNEAAEGCLAWAARELDPFGALGHATGHVQDAVRSLHSIGYQQIACRSPMETAVLLYPWGLAHGQEIRSRR